MLTVMHFGLKVWFTSQDRIWLSSLYEFQATYDDRFEWGLIHSSSGKFGTLSALIKYFNKLYEYI